MPDITSQIEAALQSPETLVALEKLVYSLAAEGLTRDAIYQAFLEYHNTYQYSDAWLAQEKKNGGDHPVDLTLDRIWGWCSPDRYFDI